MSSPATLAAPAAQPSADKAQARRTATLQRIVELVNLRRREAGLAPLTVHATLAACAQQYSAVQARQGAINHTGPDGSNPGQRLTRCGYRWRHYGENLAAGYVSAEEVVAAWMASPGHRRNILNGKVREIGLGHTYRASDPGQYYDYYVMELGTRK
ncbi:MAG TPA: CAP domain-containing protein [Herpetosiphonaceae bacterium]